MNVCIARSHASQWIMLGHAHNSHSCAINKYDLRFHARPAPCHTSHPLKHTHTHFTCSTFQSHSAFFSPDTRIVISCVCECVSYNCFRIFSVTYQIVILLQQRQTDSGARIAKAFPAFSSIERRRKKKKNQTNNKINNRIMASSHAFFLHSFIVGHLQPIECLQSGNIPLNRRRMFSLMFDDDDDADKFDPLCTILPSFVCADGKCAIICVF